MIERNDGHPGKRLALDTVDLGRVTKQIAALGTTVAEIAGAAAFGSAGRAEKDPGGVLADVEAAVAASRCLIFGEADVLAESRPRSLLELRERARELDLQPRLSLGLPGVDEAIGGGVLPGWTVILGAFSGNGKTTVCTWEAVHFAAQGHPTLYLTAELSEVEVAKRALAAIEEGTDLPTLRIWYPEGDILAAMSVVKAWSKVNAGQEKCPVLVVDYLQKLRPADGEPSRERQIAAISEELQRFGRGAGALVIAAAQLNRKSQEEGAKLHQMRESGSVEQVADLALMLKKTGATSMTVHVAKNRWGPADAEVELSVDFAKAKFGPGSQLGGVGGPSNPQKIAPMRERVLKAVLQIVKERREGASKIAVAEAVGCSADTARNYLLAIEAGGGLRSLPRPGKPTLYYPPGEGTQGVGPRVGVSPFLEGGETPPGSADTRGVQ